MTLDPIVWPTSLVTERKRYARAVSWVLPGSPAEEAGIRPGFLVLSVDGHPPEHNSLLRASCYPVGEAVFHDEKTNATYSMSYKRLPLGFGTCAPVNAAMRESIREGTHYGIDVFDPWFEGKTEIYKTLRKDFESALSPTSHRLFGSFLSDEKRQAKMLERSDRWSHLGLALSALIDGGYETANTFLIAYFDELESKRTNGDMSNVLCVANYIAARLLDQRGDHDSAKDFIARALGYDPDAKPAQTLYEKLWGRTHQSPKPPGIGEAFLVDYALHQYDPYEVLPHADELLRFSDHVGRLEGDDYALICDLGRYRANGPFLDDLFVLGALQNTLKRAPVFTHVITSFGEDPEQPWQKARKSRIEEFYNDGIRYSLGYDPDWSVDQSYDLTRSPTWFVVREGGYVSMSGWLQEQQVLADIFRADPKTTELSKNS